MNFSQNGGVPYSQNFMISYRSIRPNMGWVQKNTVLFGHQANFVANFWVFLLIPFLYKVLGIRCCMWYIIINLHIIYLCLRNKDINIKLYLLVCDFQKTGDKITMGEKFLIPNTMLIIVLTNCMTLRRMGTRAGWVKIFLIPNTTWLSYLRTLRLSEEWERGHHR